MLAKRLQGGGLVIVDCEQGLEMANPERVPQDRSQAGDLELPPGACDIPGQPGKLAQHGTGKIPDMCEIRQDPGFSLPAIAFDTRLQVAHDPGIVRLEESLGKPAEG
jgi:hypothetical protein